MENIDAKLIALGFVKQGKEWHRLENKGWLRLVVFFSPSWDTWVLERRRRGFDGKFELDSREDWTEYVLAEDLLRAIE